MKITKRQLQRIIREAYPVTGEASNAWIKFEKAIEDAALPMIDAGMEIDGVQQAMHDSIDNIFAEWEDQALYDDEEEEAMYRLAAERG
jgi:hypothetical protein